VLALVTSTHPKEPIAEAYKAIRTNLLFSLGEGQTLSTLVVTSTTPGEGKTSTACNLAVTLAQAGRRVILVDADFRRPKLHEVFGVGRNLGLGNLILRDRPEGDLITQTPVPNLLLLCSGPTPPNPSELLGSAVFNRIVEQLKAQCDVVVFDTPPVGAVTDATVLAARADGVLVVVDASRTAVSAILRTRDTLRSVNAKILGVVLNKARTSTGSEYYYYEEAAGPKSSSRAIPGARVTQAAGRARKAGGLDGGPDHGAATPVSPQTATMDVPGAGAPAVSRRSIDGPPGPPYIGSNETSNPPSDITAQSNGLGTERAIAEAANAQPLAADARHGTSVEAFNHGTGMAQSEPPEIRAPRHEDAAPNVPPAVSASPLFGGSVVPTSVAPPSQTAFAPASPPPVGSPDAPRTTGPTRPQPADSGQWADLTTPPVRDHQPQDG